MLSIVVGNVAEDSGNRVIGLELFQLPPINYKCLRVLLGSTLRGLPLYKKKPPTIYENPLKSFFTYVLRVGIRAAIFLDLILLY